MNRFLQSMMLGAGLALAATTTATADVYIIGNNVNGQQWALSQPDALMTETSSGVYEWDGEVLGTGFKFNDGTWNNGNFEGTDIVANIGSYASEVAVVLGEPYDVVADNNPGNIVFNDIEEVKSPHVVLDLNDFTVTVTGEILSVGLDYKQFELRVVSDGEESMYALTPRAYYGDYFVAKDVTMTPGAEFILMDPIGNRFGATGPGAVVSDEYLTCELTLFEPDASSYPFMVMSQLEGVYDVEIDFNEGSALLSFVKVEAPEIDYSKFNVQWTNGNNAAYKPLESTDEENVYMAYDIQLGWNGMIALSNPDQYQFFAVAEDVILDADNPSCTLNFWDGKQSWSPKYVVAQMAGKFNAKVTFDGETALLELMKVGEVEFDPKEVTMIRYLAGNDESSDWIVPAEAEGHTVVYKDVRFADYSRIVFQDNLRGIVYGGSLIEDEEGWQYFGEVITPDNLTATVTADSYTFVLVDGLEGKYDVTVVFNDDLTSATVNFTESKLPDVVSNYDGDLYLAGTVNGWELSDPAYKMTCVEPGIYEWSGMKLTSGFKINGGDWVSFFPGTELYIDFGGFKYPFTQPLYLDDPYGVELRGSDIQFADENMEVRNPKVTLNLHEMTLLVTGEVVELPGYATYDGDLYLIGDMNGWELEDSSLKMACVEPGIYEWSGETLTSGFKINGGSWDAVIPETNLMLDFGCYGAPIYVGNTYALNVGGPNILFPDTYKAVKDAKVTVNLKDMTIFVSGTVIRADVNIEEAILFTYDGDEYYAKTTENGIMYEGVRIDGVTQLAISLDGVPYGWESIDEDNIPWVTEESPETVIYSYDLLGTYPYYVLAYCEGIYTVYVEFNEDLTSATMRFEKSGELYPYVNVTMENGTSFSFRSAVNSYEKISVSTNDQFWGISGYNMNGEDDYFEAPLVTVTGTFEISEEGIDILFYTEYLGECKVIEGTTGMVEFDNAVTITRVADGVEIRNVEVGADIAVYTLGGQVVSLLKATDPEMTVRLEKGQTFIVRVGNVAAKVLM